MVTQAIQTAKIVETTSAAQYARRNCFVGAFSALAAANARKKIRRVIA